MSMDSGQHKVSIETTAHIKCGACGMWWDITYSVYLMLAAASCPVCGEKKTLEVKRVNYDC